MTLYPAETLPDMSLHAIFQKYVEARGVTFFVTKPSGQKMAEEAVEYAIEVAAGRMYDARLELADVVLSACREAELLGTTVEACIAEKTRHDTGRGQ